MGHYGAVSRKLVWEERKNEDASQGKNKNNNRRRVIEKDESISLNRPEGESVSIPMEMEIEEQHGICNGGNNTCAIEENIARLRDDHDGGQHSRQTWSLVLIPFLFVAFLGFLVTAFVLYIGPGGI